MLRDSVKLMEIIFCRKRAALAVLVLYKYCPYFSDFVGICSDLVLMWRRYVCLRKVPDKERFTGGHN